MVVTREEHGPSSILLKKDRKEEEHDRTWGTLAIMRELAEERESLR